MAMMKGLEKTRKDITKPVKLDLLSARRIVLSLDCWSKKGLTADFLGISAGYVNPVCKMPTSAHSVNLASN
jgi:hypothetical protein